MTISANPTKHLPEIVTSKSDSSSQINLPPVDDLSLFIRHRRTIKPGNMSDRPVSDKDLLAIIENGNWAPSHGQTEPWRFRIFRGASRQTLADNLAEIYRATTPADQFLEAKHTKLSTLPMKAPVAILVWMKRQEIRKIPEIEEVEAVACAIQNMHLTASAMGMAAFWSSPKVLYRNEMNEWMSIGDDDKCLGIFYLGWPTAGYAWPSAERGPISEKIEWA